MNQQLVTMAVGLGLSQAARRLDLDTPERLWGIRTLYFTTNVIIFLLYLYIAAKVSWTRLRVACSDSSKNAGADLASIAVAGPQKKRQYNPEIRGAQAILCEFDD